MKAWFEKIADRPAVKRGLEVLADRRRTTTEKDSWEIMFGAKQFEQR